MKMCIKYRLIVVILLIALNLNGQTLNQSELKDLTKRALERIKLFQDYSEAIASGRNSVTTRKKAIELGIKLFIKNGSIEERGKGQKNDVNYSPRKYLETLFQRGMNNPTIVDFDLVEELKPENLTVNTNTDGTVTYSGSILFKQYYCKLKPVSERVEPTANNPETNCSYHDTTLKRAYFEIVLVDSAKGKLWITLISRIDVIKVY
jgi:hypothetical protein